MWLSSKAPVNFRTQLEAIRYVNQQGCDILVGHLFFMALQVHLQDSPWLQFDVT